MNHIFSKGIKGISFFFGTIILLGLGYYFVRNELTPKYQAIMVEPNKIEFSRNFSGEIAPIETSKVIAKSPIRVKNTFVETGEFVKQGTELIEIEVEANVTDQLSESQKKMDILRIRNQIADNTFQIDQLKQLIKALESQVKSQKLLYEQGAVAAESFKELEVKLEHTMNEMQFKKEQEQYYNQQIEIIQSGTVKASKEPLFFANTDGLVKKVGNKIVAQQDVYIVNMATLGTDLYSGSDLITMASVNGENIAIKCAVADELREKFERADTIQLIADGKSTDLSVVKKVNQKPMQVYLKPENALSGKMIGQQVAIRFKCTVDADLVVPVSAVIPDKILKEGESGAIYVVEKRTERDDLYEVRRAHVTIDFVGDNYVSLKFASGGKGNVVIKAPESSEIEGMKVRIYE